MDLRQTATAIVKKLQDKGHIAYFAGGWVRDFLLGTPSFDIDIATSATPKQVQKLFKKTVPIGINFGIVLVIENTHPFEVAMFRKEEGEHDGRRPSSVTPCSPEKDAQRRDFTINGMFYDPIAEKLYDYVKGQEDLEKGIIRTIGRAQDRFDEDRLRMIRAIRYACRFEFTIEEKTEDALNHHATRLFPSVSIERICAEFDKLHLTAHFKEGMVLMHRFRLLQEIFPHTKEMSSAEIGSKLALIPFYSKELPLIAFLLPLFDKSSLTELLQLCISLKRPNREQEFVKQYHQITTFFSSHPLLDDDVVFVKIASAPYFKSITSIYALTLSDGKAFHKKISDKVSEFHTQIQRIVDNNPLVKAMHLIDKGVLPGKQMGVLLKKAEALSILHKSSDIEWIVSTLLSL